MADVNRGNRPLSPFMLGTDYRAQITSMMSIGHRIAGVAMLVGGIGIVWWLLAAATDPEHFRTIDGLWTSWIGNLVWIGILLAFCYHLLNGIRHLAWDSLFGFELPTLRRSGYAVLIGAVVLAIIVLIAA